MLFGDVNPSGRLPFSYIRQLSGHYALWDYRDTTLNQPYYEGIFVGYRYFDKNSKSVLYPFGYGLSYTSFRFGQMEITDRSKYDYSVKVNVTNTGNREGTEIVQLYVADPVCSVERPVKELKAFARVNLKPGETRTVHMTLDKSSFAFWNPGNGTWMVEPGNFDILVGQNSQDIALLGKITIR